MPASARPRLVSTPVLLTCAALAAVQLLLHLATVPMMTVLAPLAPHAYALVAGLYSLMPFLARRLTRRPGAATLTSGIAAVFVSGTNSAGFIVVVPLVLAGAIIDVTLWRSDARGPAPEWRYLLAASAAGCALFILSLSVFSAEHRTAVLLLGTLSGRVAGEVVVALASRALAPAIRRAGVGRTPAG